MPNKKQIVFVEPDFSMSVFNMAKTLKSTNNYETILISFANINKDLPSQAYDKIFNLKLDYLITPKNILKIWKKLQSREGKIFMNNIKKLNPYIVQVTGPHILSLITLKLMKKYQRVYFVHDIWQYYGAKFSLKGPGKMHYLNGLIDRLSFKNCDGILNKCGEGALDYTKEKPKVPYLDFLPYCLDKLIIQNYPEKLSRKDNEIHIVYPGCTWIHWEGHVSFVDVINKITSQKIHFHLYASTLGEGGEEIFKNMEKTNKYFHIHPVEPVNILNKSLSKYDYGIIPDFCDDSINSVWMKTGISGKLFSYIESGLPVIVNKQFKFMDNIMAKNNMSISVSYEDLSSLKKIITKYKYPTKDQIKKQQEDFKISNHIQDLKEFYTKIHKLKRNKV
ncbi:hypothetical protein ACFL0X_01165 [Nanoarchaeota archaeon]